MIDVEANTAECMGLVYDCPYWGYFLTDTVDCNSKALTQFVLYACNDFCPDPRTLSDPMTRADEKALFDSVKYRLSIAPNYKQMVAFIPIFIIMIVVNIIIELIIKYFLNKTNSVVRQGT